VKTGGKKKKAREKVWNTTKKKVQLKTFGGWEIANSFPAIRSQIHNQTTESNHHRVETAGENLSLSVCRTVKKWNKTGEGQEDS